ncbi:LamG-like jellyroll fold domain-containing protein [Streptomyces longwoodensis]|uniref:LamG domain-containing protein n=1 Tax=Streptomyces longwoodensis TaxID=68231 RepID=UPI003F57AFC4
MVRDGGGVRRRRGCVRLRGAAAATAVLAVASVLLAVPAHQASAAPSAPTDSDGGAVTEAQRASTSAKESGQRVEVTGERTERTTVYANPDGFTFTLEQSVVPIRVEKPDGGWQAPDATLAKRSDGSVGPKAAAVDIAFSPGGERAPLAAIEDQGKSLALTWDGALPAPQLDGPSALYSEVLPGVDLKVTATPQSFQPVFVVKTPEAAASDKLKKLTFGLESRGLEVREGASGSLAAVDDSGRTVFKAPPARMWDSAGEPSGPQVQLMTADTPGGTEAGPSDPSETAPSGSGVEPGQGDKVARMDVSVTDTALSVVPDPQMLAETEASAFPVFIDPTVTWGESERTLLRSDGYESYGWSNGDDGQGKGAGKCGTWNGYYCGPGYVQKLYFEFSPASLKGKKILDATFRVTEPWAFQCDPRWVDLVRTNNISSSTTWSSRPAELDLMVDRNISAGRGSLCDPDSPDAPIEFNDNPDETNENLTPTVQSFAAGKFAMLTLEVKAHDETDTAAWKRFKNDAVLAVKYVGLPATPTEVGVVAGNSYLCASNSASPNIVGDTAPYIQGKPKTASGGSVGANLRIRWRLEKYDGSAWSLAMTDVDSPTSGYVGNLINQKRRLTTLLQDGTLYRLKALTLSYYEDGSNRLNSGYTAPCYFKVDTSGPKPPQVAFGSPYTECASVCAAHGGPGVPGTVIFKPAAGDTNVVSYQYRLSEQEAWSAAIPAVNMPVTITPQRAGMYTLHVLAKDNVSGGRPGGEAAVDFKVADLAPVGRWHFGEDTGVAADAATWDGSSDATLNGGAVRDSRGRRGELTHDATGAPLDTSVTDKGLRLNGTTAYAATSSPVLDTSTSYTVSAWVMVDPGVAHTMTVLTQSPDTANPFAKKYIPFGLSYAGGEDNKWSLSVMASDGGIRKAAALQPTPRGVWTHVAGVHDAATKKISLYVNGVLQSTVDAGTAWKAVGPLQIGRGIWADAYTDYLQGSQDEVAVWQAALPAAAIADEARLKTSDTYADVELVARWEAGEATGSPIQDSTSGYQRPLTLTGGASLDGESIVLNGVDAAATTPGPVLDDTGSFTVSTLVSLDSQVLAGKPIGFKAQVLGQRAADGSAWGLWYELTGKPTVLDPETMEEKTVMEGYWRFGRLSSAGVFTAVSSLESAVTDTTVRLTGVYDAQSRTAGLYGVDSEADKALTAQAGSGEFAVGKGFTTTQYLPGRVAEVKLWAGAMAGSEQVDEVTATS